MRKASAQPGGKCIRINNGGPNVTSLGAQGEPERLSRREVSMKKQYRRIQLDEKRNARLSGPYNKRCSRTSGNLKSTANEARDVRKLEKKRRSNDAELGEPLYEGADNQIRKPGKRHPLGSPECLGQRRRLAGKRKKRKNTCISVGGHQRSPGAD